MALSILVIIVIFVAKQYFDFDFAQTLILIFFGFSIVWKMTGRAAVVLALFFLAGTPILLFFDSKELAETFAVYAYYFLVIAVIDEILSLKREKPLQ